MSINAAGHSSRPCCAEEKHHGEYCEIGARTAGQPFNVQPRNGQNSMPLVRVRRLILQLVGKATLREHTTVDQGGRVADVQHQAVRPRNHLYYTSAAITNTFIDLSVAPGATDQQVCRSSAAHGRCRSSPEARSTRSMSARRTVTSSAAQAAEQIEFILPNRCSDTPDRRWQLLRRHGRRGGMAAAVVRHMRHTQPYRFWPVTGWAVQPAIRDHVRRHRNPKPRSASRRFPDRHR
ncbi:MAG: hypothetical protein U5N85_15705 [Arcicella sp.]|nr:hypothetical protein [Arcicella sp.]